MSRVSTRNLVRINQRWRRKRTKDIYVIYQIHRAGRGEVRMYREGDAKKTLIPVPLGDLRRTYVYVP